MKLSTKWWVAGISFLVTIETGIGSGKAVSLDHMFPADWIPGIQAWCLFLAFIGGTALTTISAISIAQNNEPTTSSGKAASWIIGGFISLLLLGGTDAHAQLRKPQFTGNIIADAKANTSGVLTPQQLLDGIASVNLKMLQYAKAQAKAANNTLTLPCWSAWVDLISKAQQPLVDDSGQPLTKPDPNFFGDIESASELLQALNTGGSIQIGCGAMLDASKKSVMQLATALVTGNGLVGLLPVIP